MKNFLFLLLVCSFNPLLAQDTGLKNVTGGRLGLVVMKGAQYGFDAIDVTGNDNDKVKSFSFYPYTAWRISSHSLLGWQLGTSIARSSTSNDGFPGTFVQESFSNNYGTGLFLRYYFRPNAKLSPYLEPGTGLSYTSTKDRTKGSDNFFNKNKYLLFELTLSPGISYHISDNLGLLLQLGQIGFFHQSNNYDSANSKTNYLSSNFSLSSFTWGVEYRWEKKEKAAIPKN